MTCAVALIVFSQARVLFELTDSLCDGYLSPPSGRRGDNTHTDKIDLLRINRQNPRLRKTYERTAHVIEVAAIQRASPL